MISSKRNAVVVIGLLSLMLVGIGCQALGLNKAPDFAYTLGDQEFRFADLASRSKEIQRKIVLDSIASNIAEKEVSDKIAISASSLLKLKNHLRLTNRPVDNLIERLTVGSAIFNDYNKKTPAEDLLKQFYEDNKKDLYSAPSFQVSIIESMNHDVLIQLVDAYKAKRDLAIFDVADSSISRIEGSIEQQDLSPSDFKRLRNADVGDVVHTMQNRRHVAYVITTVTPQLLPYEVVQELVEYDAFLDLYDNMLEQYVKERLPKYGVVIDLGYFGDAF